MTPQLLCTSILILALVLQAWLPRYRLLVVGTAASSAWASVVALGGVSSRAVLAEVPWDVIVILVGLGLLSLLFAETRVFSRLAVLAGRVAAQSPRRFVAAVLVTMYLVSALVNNITALLLVLPALLVLLRLRSASQRFVRWLLGALLVACNLGGAATPIGDFPAVLLLGRGAMGFSDYLVCAAPATAGALLLLILFVVLGVRPERDLESDPYTVRTSVAVMEALHRNVRIDAWLLALLVAVLALMVVAWTISPPAVGPELVCAVGVGAALLLRPSLGERLARTGVDVEAVAFLVALFLLVGAVRQTGVPDAVARSLLALDVSPAMRLAIFLVIAGLLTGVFSAGPSMAALLDVANALARELPPATVYVGLALSVCAGSSLLLTAATSGPLAQMLTERAGLRDAAGGPVQFDFRQFLPVGLVSFSIILLVALGWALSRT